MRESRNNRNLLMELLMRFILFLIFGILEFGNPFHRKIHSEEMWLYKNPRTESYVPVQVLWPFICIVPFIIVFITNIFKKNKGDCVQAFLGVSLALGITGCITNLIKVIIGRPRPDFFYRCFPDGIGDFKFPCTGDEKDIREGMKSFPSGHSSFAFVSMTFCSLYLCGKLHVFNSKGRGHSWRLLLSVLPLLAALCIALSRTCDYHHHWQDVLVGSLIGIFVGYLCYYQYYPSLNHPNSSLPYSILVTLPKTENGFDLDNEDLQSVSVKWI